MVQINLTYQGQLRIEATHEPSQKTLITDAPVDNHGKGESFSPTDLVATALGSCMLTIMGIVAERDDISLEGTSVNVEKKMVADPERRIGELIVDFMMPAGLDVKQRKKLERAALTCPVHKSLDPRINIPVHFNYPQQTHS